jgi:putative sterol carrier protein
VYDWNVGGQSYIMDLKNGAGGVKKGSGEKADCTLTMAEPVFLELISGKLNAQQAFMQGKLKIGGNMGKDRHKCCCL